MALFASLIAMGGAFGPAAAMADPAPLPETLLTVRLNGVETGDTALLLRGADGRLLVGAADLLRWRLRLPASAPYSQNAETFYRLDDLPGASYTVDEPHQALSVQAPADLFDATRIDLTAQRFPTPSPTPPGGFFNYDLSSTHASGQHQTGTLLELGGFNQAGAGVGNFVVRDGFPTGPHLLRMETTWSRDFRERQASLRLGDAVSRAGQWGHPVRFGGVQWATNFETQPGFVPFPLPSLAGEAALPSTVDLYVNGALQVHRDVPAGPFDLQQLPVMTGDGEARLVVRDMLGREQVIVTPYFATPHLLREGLHDFSYEAGRIRDDFGLASNHYGRAALALTHRLGVSDALTVEAHGEWVESQQTGGLGAAMHLPGFGTVNAAVAASRDDTGAGGLVSLGADHQSRDFGFGGTAQLTSSGFVQIGQQPGQPAVRQNLQAYGNVTTRHGSFSLSYLMQTPRDKDPVRLLNLGYSVSLGSLGFLGIALLRSGGPQGKLIASLTFTRSLDARTTASAGATVQSGQTEEQLLLQHNLPVGSGAGYNLRATGGQNQRLEAGGSLQNSAGMVGLDVAVAGDEPAARVNASGGLVLLDGGVYASRRVDSSFALVQVPGQAGVGVYVDNQLAGRTDADGNALLPRLRPFQKNPVRIEQADLPLDAQIDSLQMDAVPGFRSGTVLRFPVRRSRGATLTVTSEDGQAVPPGAIAEVDGQADAFAFGLDGGLYLTGLQALNKIRVHWPDHRCGFDLALADSGDPIPDLGAHPCLALAP